MNVYIFQAALLCEECGENLKTKAVIASRATSEDSDEYPQGPYGDGGGEADCPQSCDSCFTFLRNPLTSDGAAYVREALQAGTGNAAVLNEWREFYSYITTEA